MISSLRFTEEALETMATDLLESHGQETLWIGYIDADKMVTRVTVGARGTIDQVPAIFPHMEKGDVVVHNHPSGHLSPSAPDLSVASALGNQGIGFYIVDNALSRAYVVVEPLVLKPLKNLDPQNLSVHLKEGGSLSRLKGGFESRSQQVELLESIAQAFNDDSLLAAEAGTGVGKSFAYLIPALEWARVNQQRVVISTATINLQQQLMEKDIPQVKAMLESDQKVVLVKGRRNYVCPHRLTEELREAAFEGIPPEELEVIKDWAQITSTGSVHELGFLPKEGLWSRICSDSDSCSGLKCAQLEGCFFARARKEASGAGVLVVNHHLLFSDLSLRVEGFGFENTAILPAFTRLIIDEAHGIEKAATSYFSEDFSKFSLGRSLNRLYRRTRTRSLGLVISLQGLTTGDVDLAQVPDLVASLSSQAQSWNASALEFMDRRSSVRLLDPGEITFDNLVLEPLREFQKTLGKLIKICKKLQDHIPEEESDSQEAFELRIVTNRLEGASQLIDRFFVLDQDSDHVYWMERNKDFGGDYYLRLVITPLDLSQLMVEAMLEPMKSVVFTSATLTVKSQFYFWGSRLGLHKIDRQRLVTRIFPSPFPYEDQVLLALPRGVPAPDSAQYAPYLVEAVRELILASGGSALVLFTSYESMTQTFEALQEPLAEARITAYRQGTRDRGALLEMFKNEITSVLFATDSFWEGVDSPGNTLTQVILCKLPFRVPTDPVIAARMERMEQEGRDAFRHFSLPDAVTRFKQGFGRLMRKKSDYGVVVVLDPRIITKGYGTAFLESLPPAKQLVGPLEGIVEEVRGFLHKKTAPGAV